MKFPYLKALGRKDGWYRVGPLARMNNCDFIGTPLAEEARKDFFQQAGGGPVHASLAYHWARMIEALHCAENITRKESVSSRRHEEHCSTTIGSTHRGWWKRPTSSSPPPATTRQ